MQQHCGYIVLLHFKWVSADDGWWWRGGAWRWKNSWTMCANICWHVSCKSMMVRSPRCCWSFQFNLVYSSLHSQSGWHTFWPKVSLSFHFFFYNYIIVLLLTAWERLLGLSNRKFTGNISWHFAEIKTFLGTAVGELQFSQWRTVEWRDAGLPPQCARP